MKPTTNQKPFKVKLTKIAHKTADKYVKSQSCLICTAIKRKFKGKVQALFAGSDEIWLNGIPYKPDTEINCTALGSNNVSPAPHLFPHYSGVALNKIITFTPVQ